MMALLLIQRFSVELMQHVDDEVLANARFEEPVFRCPLDTEPRLFQRGPVIETHKR